MESGRRNTHKHSFKDPNLEELRKLVTLMTNIEDTVYRCFTFPDFQLVPTLEEYAHLIPKLQVIVSALHLKKSNIDNNFITKGCIRGITIEFLIKKATYFASAGSMTAFEDILALLIYGMVLFPNIDNFVDVNVIRIFLLGNPVPTPLGDICHSIHFRTDKHKGTIVCCAPLLYRWFISHLPHTPAFWDNKGCLRWSQGIMSLTSTDIVWYSHVFFYTKIVDSCGEFSNVPLLGTKGGINYNHVLAKRQMGYPLNEKPGNLLVEGFFFINGKEGQGLKSSIVHAWHNIHRKGSEELGKKNCWSNSSLQK
ncbi:uncharacterized protein LOC131651985 [Vicia villosa]|uniref:uncharacterized protein LOC131651985 n=1 Tax=Vicia villosa TaxID=3911 RepID=UPI00273B42FA|nr:uncharacterized protein LOC131651985 [Vicia villosa]